MHRGIQSLLPQNQTTKLQSKWKILILEQYNFDMGNFEGDWADDPAVRESILREAAEQVLWDSVETVPEDLLEDF